MCGIAGIIQKTPRLGQVHLQRMTDALQHRGPNGEGHWCRSDQQVMLGHRRLSIIDLSDQAAQPMHFQQPTSSLTRYSIVHNGEIYNYIELRKQLRNEGYRFQTESDTEVILAAYDFWQDECVEQFDGMFAFAIWDHEQQQLFAARDRFGEKPFYFYFDKQKLVFASEMKALWAAGIPRQVNQQMLFNFITIGYTDNPNKPHETFFQDIFQLPPAHRLFYDWADEAPHTESYWEIDLDHQNIHISSDEAQEQFRYLLSASVRRRLRSDVPMGCSLSGGIDSSSIALLATQLGASPQQFQAYTARFTGYEKDESSAAAAWANQLGLPHHVIDVGGGELADLWWTFFQAQEEPMSSASAFAQFCVYREAARNSTIVLLDGQGADETLAGYTRYYKWYWQELFQKRKLRRSGEMAKARALGIQEEFGLQNIMAALFPELASVILERQYLVNALRHRDLHPDFVKLQGRAAYYSGPEIRSLNGQLHFNTCVHGLGELLHYADRNSMYWGREVRLPFLNHQLVEFLFSLPAHFKIREGWTKWLLRSSMADKLPETTVWQKEKIGFEPPQMEWMKQPALLEISREARAALVKEKILLASALDKRPEPASAYDAKAWDWRYLAAGSLFLK